MRQKYHPPQSFTEEFQGSVLYCSRLHSMREEGITVDKESNESSLNRPLGVLCCVLLITDTQRWISWVWVVDRQYAVFRINRHIFPFLRVTSMGVKMTVQRARMKSGGEVFSVPFHHTTISNYCCVMEWNGNNFSS